MKNQILLSLAILFMLILSISSCSKSVCQTCTIDHSPDIRVEVCPDGATTYSGNKVILEGELGGVPVASYAFTLELSGYDCH